MQKKTLVVLLIPHLTLSLIEKFPLEKLNVGSNKYRNLGEGIWQGFYDWLRDASGKIIGVRFWRFEDADLQLSNIASLPYVLVNRDKDYIEIYFSDSRQYVIEKSDDQDFGAQRIFVDDGGTWAIALDVSMLNELEFESIKDANVAWISVDFL